MVSQLPSSSLELTLSRLELELPSLELDGAGDLWWGPIDRRFSPKMEPFSFAMEFWSPVRDPFRFQGARRAAGVALRREASDPWRLGREPLWVVCVEWLSLESVVLSRGEDLCRGGGSSSWSL